MSIGHFELQEERFQALRSDQAGASRGEAVLRIPVVLMMEGSILMEAWQIGMAPEASLLILLEPVLNPVWVWLVIGKRPDVATFVGGAAILLAMGLEATAADVR